MNINLPFTTQKDIWVISKKLINVAQINGLAREMYLSHPDRVIYPRCHWPHHLAEVYNQCIYLCLLLRNFPCNLCFGL